MNTSMEVIQFLLTYLAYTAFLGGTMVCILQFIRSRRKAAGLKQINYQQAKLAMLRMTFKSKVKKKAQQYRVSFRKPIPKGEVADLALEEMVDLKYESGADFQKYFDICRKINVFLKADQTGAPADQASAAPPANGNPPIISLAQKLGEDFMSSDIKNELEIIKIIKEITEVCAELNKLIDAYNLQNKDKQLPNIGDINFVSLIDVNKVFNAEENMIAASENTHSDLSKVA